jgi:4-methyl-5(b-hydroxyethyl)-thiazole monophosphate biosynthesis
LAIVLIPLAEGAEELETVTIIDLLRRASIEVVVAGLKPGPVRCSRGTVIAPDMTLDDALTRDYDMVVLPGGQPGATHLEADPRVIALVKRMANAQRYTAAICAAPRVLAAAGVLDGRRATGFPGTLDPVRFPHVRIEEQPVVTDGRIVTSRGPGTAIDFALSLIDLLAGREQRERVQAGLQRPAAHHLN